MNLLGVVHTVFAVVAIVAGGTVVLLPKGTRWHRTLGHLYATAMIGLIVTAFSIYRLFGGLGPFHFAALVSLVTLVAGMGSALFRRPRGRWIEFHAAWMSWSYIGLMAAFAAELLTRVVIPAVVPLLSRRAVVILFWVLVLVGGGAMTAVGAWLQKRQLPATLAQLPETMRRDRAALRRLDGGRDDGPIGPETTSLEAS